MFLHGIEGRISDRCEKSELSCCWLPIGGERERSQAERKQLDADKGGEQEAKEGALDPFLREQHQM